MSYRIEKNEALSTALGRIAAEEIALALAELKQPDRARAMHNTRKSLKRLRALLRSLRVALPKPLYRRENRRLAAAGRKIAPLRDLHVQLRTLEKLHASGAASREIEKRLLRRQQARARGIPALRRTVRTMLSASRDSLASLPMDRATPDHLIAGLRRVYKRGRASFKMARRRRTPENLHEWRKQSKILRHGLDLIERLCPKQAAAMSKKADQLCQSLGDDHDLFLLWEALRREDSIRPAGDYRRLARVLNRKRARHQARAFKLGRELFAEKPGLFSLRLQGWLQLHSTKS